MENEMPQMMSSAYTANTWGGDNQFIRSVRGWDNQSVSGFNEFNPNAVKAFINSKIQQETITTSSEADMTEEIEDGIRRIVQVYIVDPDENVPIEKALLYKDEEPYMTELTDEELFFEISVKEILDKHNAAREEMERKNYSGKGRKNLEKIRVRDLRMTVVTIASF